MGAYSEGFEEDVESLVGAALKPLPKPYGPDIIEDVFVELEQSPHLLRNYQQLCVNHDRRTVNQRVGHFTKVLAGYRAGKSGNKTSRTTLAQSYTELLPPL